MNMIVLKVLLIVSSPVTLLAQTDHNRRKHPPDTVPEADLRPLDRFETTVNPNPHTRHNGHHHGDYYDYNDEFDYSSAYQDNVCGPEEWKCKDGTCLQSDLRCNRVIECRDMSDEMDCGHLDHSCETDEWQCKDGECIDESLHCNQITDCRDMTDEMDCDLEYRPFMSTGGAFRAWNWIICITVLLLISLF